MVLPVHLPSGSVVIGQTIAQPGSGATAGTSPTTSFATQYLNSLAQTQQAANQSASAYAHGGGPSLAQVVTQNAQADLASQEMSLLVGKALSTYQSIMNMQV